MQVLKLIMREAIELLAIGLLVGTALSLFASRTASSLLYGLKNNDPATFGAAVALLAIVAAAASFIPAQKASRLNPLQSLREE